MEKVWKSELVSERSSGEKNTRTHLGLLGGDSGVAGDELGHDSTSGLDSSRERSDIEEEKVLSLLRGVPGEDGSLNGGSVGDGLVGVDRLVGLLRRYCKVSDIECEERNERTLPLKKSETSFWTRGIRVDPPTRTIS